MPYASHQAPRTQYDRNLSIMLKGGGDTRVYTFPIKPEEFQLQHPARVTTTQTLQGIYQDFGGLGIVTATYQGNTGWRRRTLDNQVVDGFDNFRRLYENIYIEYHKRVHANADPTSIKCLVMDDLYDKVYQVSLDDFQATKSKSNPLLYFYVLRMTVQNSHPNSQGRNNLTGLDDDVPSVTQNPSDQIPFALNEVFNGVSVWGANQIRYYVVQAGDSLESISTKYYGNPLRSRDIANANGIVPPYIINPGIQLAIPW